MRPSPPFWFPPLETQGSANQFCRLSAPSGFQDKNGRRLSKGHSGTSVRSSELDAFGQLQVIPGWVRTRTSNRFMRRFDREPRIMKLTDCAVAFARLAELMPAARASFGVRDLAVFGSVARGDASDASDLDVLVDFVGSATFDGYMGLKLFLEDSLGVKVDLVTRASLKPRLRARIEAEARRVA
jgi:predicted nucleotidyltransferase